MESLPDFLLLAVILFLILGSTLAGLARGKRIRKEQAPDGDHLGTIQGALLGLLGLVLGFSFSGAMGRFVDRQDALASEANAIETAYQRSELLPGSDEVRRNLREYAALRLELFREIRPTEADRIEAAMRSKLDAARIATFEAVRQSPQFAAIAVPGLEGVGDEFVRRSALQRRHLPTEMILVLVLSSCVSMATIGYGVGLAERRSVGSVLALAALIAITLFVTLDFDRPRKGLIRLDGTPLERLAADLSK